MHIDQTNYPHAHACCRRWRAVKEIAATQPHRQTRGLAAAGLLKMPAGPTASSSTPSTARINSRGSITFAGRSNGEIYQREQERDCRNIHACTQQRIILRQILKPELRQHCGHLITPYGEE